MRTSTKKVKPNLDESIAELVAKGQFYWQDGQLYQNLDYKPKYILPFNKKR